MAQNVIIAEFVNTKSNNQMLKIGVKTESGKCFKTMHFNEAIKALHYMFILQRNVHAKIDEESMALVRKTHEAHKAEQPVMEAEQPIEAPTTEVVEEPKAEEPARKARAKKAKAEGEKPARKSRAKKNSKKEAA